MCFCECCGLWVFSGCVLLNWLLDAGGGGLVGYLVVVCGFGLHRL